MTTALAEAPRNTNGNGTGGAIVPSRLPYNEIAFRSFGIDKGSWKALVEAVFPNAQSTESVILALSYCRARKLDPFKRNVHIVPIWDKNQKRMVDTIWPGIGELRTTAFRTGQYAGRDPVKFGNDMTERVGSVLMTFPEWAQVTVYRLMNGQRVPFAGPKVYWLETYSTAKHDSDDPNAMWRDRPRGQLEKCAEAAALRAAFPEEVGNDMIAEEAEGTSAAAVTVTDKPVDRLNAQLSGRALPHPTDDSRVIDPTPEVNAPASATVGGVPAPQPQGEAPAAGAGDSSPESFDGTETTQSVPPLEPELYAEFEGNLWQLVRETNGDEKPFKNAIKKWLVALGKVGRHLETTQEERRQLMEAAEQQRGFFAYLSGK